MNIEVMNIKNVITGLILISALASVIVIKTSGDVVTFYISPYSNDATNGKEGTPVQSVHQAQKLAEPYYGKKEIHFVFMDGVHYLDSTLAVTPDQSGTAGCPVIYEAQHEGKAVISGGKRLGLQWEKWQGNVYVASLTDPTVSVIDQLYVNGTRKPMSSYPNRNGKNVFDAWDLSHQATPNAEADLFNPRRVATWKNPKGAYIHAMHSSLWGDMHWLVTGKKSVIGKPGKKGTLETELVYVGGWQNNRPSAMHPVYRMIENVFEELDEPGEWFFNPTAKKLYYYPEATDDINQLNVECVRLTELVRFDGKRSAAVSNTSFRGLVFRHAARTFMENKEPLLRSDWTTCRKGAITYYGAENCELVNCEFDQVGGNAICVNGYNRNLLFKGCYIHDSGANGIAFVGDPSSVRSPLFRYGGQNYQDIDRTPGPKNDLYPSNCKVEECLLTRTGRVEKQTAPVQISMSHCITVSHCSIYEVPRAGINISEGTFGGHVIEYCDIFDTVLETGDHGSFNSWGRDRFWSPDIYTTSMQVSNDSTLNSLDMLAPNTIRNSRWKCNHGWDIDLDDGSSHYRIYNNVLLNGGLKLREGYDRVATNNIIINNSLHPHVWYKNSGDVIKHNIFFGAYFPIAMNVDIPEGEKWGKTIDENFFATNEAEVKRYTEGSCDAHSLVGDPLFADAEKGDYTVNAGSKALEVGFKNFDMKHFGVTLPHLRKMARTPELPEILISKDSDKGSATLWHKARIKNVETLGEQSATGLKDMNGVLVLSVDKASELGQSGLLTNDVILAIDGKEVKNVSELIEAERNAKNCNGFRMNIWRNQTPESIEVKFY